MPLDIGTGLKILDYIIKYGKPLRRSLDFLFRDEPTNLKLEVPVSVRPQKYFCHTSQFIALTAIDQRKIIYISSANVGWNDHIVTLEFTADPETDKILQLVELGGFVLAAHWYKAVMCKCTQKERYISGHKTWFKFHFDIVQSDFTGFGEYASSPQHFRERARRLLFKTVGDALPNAAGRFRSDGAITVGYLNTYFREIQIRGGAGVVESPLLDLFIQFGQNPDRFLQIAWIQLAMDLQTTGVATDINSLELELEGTRLYINLRAKRHSDDMSVEGYCEMAGTHSAHR